ncbi:MAG: PIN domain-containing protein [Actinomycetia bacterium]|nr:PIN domain-containing protein [Actinomycetes bacterium]
MADFLDTNVLVYAFDAGEPEKRARAQQVMRERPDAVISTQVLLEWYSVVTRKFSPPMSAEEAEAGLAVLAELDVVPADAELVVRAVETARAHQVSIWDAMILETASLAGCDTLLTEDLSDGSIIRGVSVRNPFAAS